MAEQASKQAFSKVRHKISYTGFKPLKEEFLKEAYNFVCLEIIKLRGLP